MAAPVPVEALADAVARADADAPFLRSLIRRRPEIIAALETGGLDAALALARERAATLAGLGTALRHERAGVALAVALADLAGAASLRQVTTALSAFADRALNAAVVQAIRERSHDADPTGFAVLALGKHGGRELNYSSDLDPILLFDPETLPRRSGEEPVEAAVRIARRLLELLQTRDKDGYVFRIDLRLRPSPEATPLALPVEAAISYYESSALPWERAAFVRARSAAGDIGLGDRFLEAIRPFVWRRSLGYGAVSEIRAISRRIRAHHAQGQRFGPGFDLKRGRGGIREVEFFTQIHQLIHGGRAPELRVPATLDALQALAGVGRISAAEAQDLADAYCLFRTVEHRLQMVDDQQTHSLPRDPAALDGVARLHGLTDGETLLAALRPYVERVCILYDSLEPDQRSPAGDSAGEPTNFVADSGFTDLDALNARITSWRGGSYRALRSPAAREALEAALPLLVRSLGQAPDPQAALVRFDAMLAGLPSAINLFRLLEAQAPLARLLGDILSHAPALAQQLGRRPDLLDGLIDATAFDPAPDVATLVEEFGRRERGDDFQALLDAVRRRVGERRFALGTQIVAASGDPVAVAGGYARVAEAALEVLARATVAEFEAAHGWVPGAELAVLALGRLGGSALTHASDLDLVYLFGGDHLAESDGRRPLNATTYFNRLAQRVTAALSVQTAAGPLYEVDTRLRPSGAQGLLAVSVDSFDRYQRESAWTWEHMALTRARPVFGPPALRAEIQAVIDRTLDRPRDAAVLVADAVKMRAEMARHKPPAGPFDVKLIPGGLVDAEFTVHVQQLRYRTGFDPRLRRAARALAEAGLLSTEVENAHALLTRLLVTLRLVSPSSAEPPEQSRQLVAQACGQADWPTLLSAYDAAREVIAAEWARVSTAA